MHAGGAPLDGGAMFGVVPRPLWERKIAPTRATASAARRCAACSSSTTSGLVLIDTGLGNKEPARFQELYGVENAGAGGRTRLEEALARLGHAPEDVALVINTHLHFDHAGGNTYRDADGRLRPSFPNARYVVPAGEYGFATHVNERTAASYLAPNFVPLHERGVLDEVAAGTEVVAGLRLLPTPGHTPHHTSVLVESAGETLCFLGDVVPTSAHLPLPWIMGYDVAPLVTLESKRALLARASAEGWTVVFEHDAAVAWGRVVDGERAPRGGGGNGVDAG
jgi:glyoxylase-like metal-dependent hydrolase (beta-lactamase superfamily II)